jgi:hypothetical protein
MPPKNPVREKRLAAALRQNLRRRKEAGRARAKPAQVDPEAGADNTAPDISESAPKTD